MKMILLYIGLPIFFGCSLSKNNQSKLENEINFNLEIKQNLSGSYVQNTFVFVMDKFFIYESRTTKEGQLTREKIYSRRINANGMSEIKRLSLTLFDLNSHYTKAELGGVHWEINLMYEGKNKQINIESYSVKEINLLFDAINKIIPNDKPAIYKY